MDELIQKILTIGMSKEQAIGATKFSWRLSIFVSIAAGWGLFSPFVQGFARAGDIDAQVKSSLAAVQAKLQEHDVAVNVTAALVKRQLSSSVAGQIRGQVLKRCKAASGEREQINREIDRLQEEYVEYRGSKYELPACGDL